MDKQSVLQLINSDPRLVQAVDVMEDKLASMGISAEMLQEIIGTLEYVLSNPQAYPQVRAAAIERGFVREQDLPPEFNELFVVVMLGAMYELQERIGRRAAFARGGLAQVAAMGRGGDTMLAHINPREAEVLRRMGGSGTINPNTGLREFKGGGIGDILAVAAPIVLDVVAPGVGTAISGALGGGLLGAVGTGALMGAGSSLLSGGDPLKGAISGALGGGLGGWVGEGIGGVMGDVMGTALSKTTTDLIGNSLVGGLGSMARGEGFGSGALSGGLGTWLGDTVSGMGDASTAFGRGVQQAGKSFGNAMAAGYTPQQALAGAALSGVARGLGPTPAAKPAPEGWAQTPGEDGMMQQLGDFQPGQQAVNTETGDLYWPAGEGAVATPGASVAGAADAAGRKFGLREAVSITPIVASLLSSAETPEQVQQQARTAMTPQQQEYFNRAAQQWDWNRISQQARSQNMGLGKYIAQNWNVLSSANNPYASPVGATQTAPVAMARGGLNSIAALAQGGGSGRDDTIDARLSDGEYVMDAETVAMLGDGSTRAGAKKLDEMRMQLRRHKGRALARGKFSPDAKSPLHYLKEAA